MEGSRLNKMLLGIFIILIGIGLFLSNLGLMHFAVFPLVVLYFGFYLWNKQKRIFGGIVLAIGLIIAFDEWFSINIFDLLIPLLVIYFGFRLLRSRRSRHNAGWKKAPGMFSQAEASDGFPNDDEIFKDSGFSHWKRKAYTAYKKSDAFSEPSQVFSSTDSKSSLFGEFHLTSGRYEMQNLHVWHGVGSVVIDLSRALLPDEESYLVIQCWVGDITVYVPVDLPVSVSAEVSVGDLEVLGQRQGGFQRRVVMSSQNYESSTKKVKIIISLNVGDIDVKYI